MVTIPEYDIVYILKEGVSSEELKYSIRSVVENMPYKRIIFYCGCPRNIKPDVYVKFEQSGYGKINRVVQTLKAVMENDDISEDFWLFNDDFYILRPLVTTSPWYNGSLEEVARGVVSKTGNDSRYTRILLETARQLKDRGLSTVSYATHTPMLINREKAKKVLKTFEPPYSFRSVYGNCWNIGGIPHNDVKISDVDILPDDSYELLSTNDKSFKHGEVGKWIRDRFQIPSRYEVMAFGEKTYCNTRE